MRERSMSKKLGFAALVALLGFIASAACNETTGDATCDTICATVGDCGGTSCLAMCIETQAACTKADQTSAFSDWVNCGPTLSCAEGADEYTVSNCALEQIELISCHVGGSSTTIIPGFDGGIISFPTKDAGSDSPVIVYGADAGDDSGETCEQTGCEIGYSCVLFDGVMACEPDTGDDAGTDAATDDASCGTCGTSCEDDCGNACTGGSCPPACVTTGCTSCTSACDLSQACSDNCGNDCCSG